MPRAQTDTPLSLLLERRAFLCRLTPDRALDTLDEADEFLRDRGMLTRTTDCSLPSLFEACHEEPYAPGKPGFGQWPRTKWSWSFALAARPGIYATKIHRGKTLYVSADVARLLDPILREEIERVRAADPDGTRILDHLAETGASTSEDLRTELGLKPKELKNVLGRLERSGTVVVRAVEPDELGRVEGFEYTRWDQVLSEPPSGSARLDELVVAAVRAAVAATEREVPRWFAWRLRFEPDLLERLVSEGRLERPEPGWLAAPESASPETRPGSCDRA